MKTRMKFTIAILDYLTDQLEYYVVRSIECT